MITPPPTSTRHPVRQQRLQLFPFNIGQIMAIMHKQDLPHLNPKIRQTRPRYGVRGHTDDLPQFYAQWERWAADVAERGLLL